MRARSSSSSPAPGFSARTADARDAKGGSHRPLGSGLDLERPERQPRSPLGQRTSSRRQTLLLRENTLDGSQPLLDKPCLLCEAIPLRDGVARSGRALGSLALERTPAVRLARRGRLECAELPRKPVSQRAGRLVPQRQALASSLQPIERRDRRLAPARGIRELVLGSRPVRQQPFEPRLGAAPRERGVVSSTLDLASAPTCFLQIELGDPRLERRDLDRELVRSLGRCGLERERSEALPHLLLDVLRAFDLHARRARA